MLCRRNKMISIHAVCWPGTRSSVGYAPPRERGVGYLRWPIPCATRLKFLTTDDQILAGGRGRVPHARDSREQRQGRRGEGGDGEAARGHRTQEKVCVRACVRSCVGCRGSYVLPRVTRILRTIAPRARSPETSTGPQVATGTGTNTRRRGRINVDSTSYRYVLYVSIVRESVRRP